MTTLDRWVGRVLLLMALVYFLMVVCSPKAKAEDDPIPHPDVLWVYSETEPALDVPYAFAVGAASIFLDCEVRTANQTPYAVLGDVVSPTNDYGESQLNIIHASTMDREGLDFWSERDRLLFAIELSKDGTDFSPWNCRP